VIVTKKDQIVNLKNPNHKFKGNPIYDFLLVFVGLFFAFFITSPDDWHNPLTLVMAVMVSGLVALLLLKFKNR
jgi:hypothetical protein